jgi:hypothetical protein
LPSKRQASGIHHDIVSNESALLQALAQSWKQDRGVEVLRPGDKEMNYEQPQYDIETSVLALGIAYAASLISLIVWIA